MSKEKEIVAVNPFAGFNVLKGDLKPEDIKDETPVEIPKEEETDPEVEVTEGKSKDFKDLDIEKQRLIDEKLGISKAEEGKSKGAKDPEVKKAEEGTKESEETEKPVFKAIVAHLIDQGIYEVDPKDLEDAEDNEELLEKATTVTVGKRVDAWKASYPEEIKTLLNFVEQGGNPKQFLDIYYKEHSWKDFKVESPESQKTAIKEYLTLNGYSQDEADEEIKDTEDLGKLEQKAKNFLPKLQKLETEQKEHLVKAQAQYAKEQEDNMIKYWEDLKTTWDKKDDINGFKLTPGVKQKVWDHMSKPVDKQGRTKLQVNNETNPDAQFLYAYLDSIGWDISKLEKQVVKKATSSLRDALNKTTDNRDKLKSGRTADPAEREEEDMFSGFKSHV